jgi:hypothetical protein
MALINCPECNGVVSSKAAACPHCGWLVRSAPTVQVQAESPSDRKPPNTAALTGTTEPFFPKEDGQILKHANLETCSPESQQPAKKGSPIGEVVGWVLTCLVMLGFSIAFPKQCEMGYLPGMRRTGGHPIPINPPWER